MATEELVTMNKKPIRESRLKAIRRHHTIDLARVEVGAANTLDAVNRALDELGPDVIVIDGQESADISAIDLAAHLGSTREGQLVVVWASDQPWGSAAARALRGKVTTAEVPRRVGVDAMLDYIRARFP